MENWFAKNAPGGAGQIGNGFSDFIRFVPSKRPMCHHFAICDTMKFTRKIKIYKVGYHLSVGSTRHDGKFVTDDFDVVNARWFSREIGRTPLGHWFWKNARHSWGFPISLLKDQFRLEFYDTIEEVSAEIF